MKLNHEIKYNLEIGKYLNADGFAEPSWSSSKKLVRNLFNQNNFQNFL